ncbi:MULTISPECIES: hypothetical protein [Clostridium]|uniref:hypothetical protein n=1 Tax=Clostridium TaxID=1485 RepID=UPI00189B026F|nr:MULTISPECIES: hypothetical protein [Clostridium]MDB2124204.1 hypothetical protein [Clostridium paraputrificum]MDC0801334.1 hypothetical protein [Clostridium paraputrificum]MDU1585095.1 hypothetical protein [Clostridium sp.]
MKKTIKYIFSQYKLLVCIILLLPLILGIITPKKYLKEMEVRFYYSPNYKVSNSVDKSLLKTINSLNTTFEKSYSDKNLSVDITPISGGENQYKISIQSHNYIDDNTTNKIYSTFKDILLEKIPELYHVSHIENNDYLYISSNINNIIWNYIKTLVLIISSLLLVSLLNSEKKSLINKRNVIIYAIFFILSTLLNLSLMMSAILFTASLIYHYSKKLNIKDNIVKLLILAISIRLIIGIALMALNLFKYGSIYSYLQPDEIFYYSSGDTIGNYLRNFSWPDLKAITGVDQYGYNLFLGFINALTGKDFFITVKIINVCFSLILIPITYDLSFSITENKQVSNLTTIIMSIMPTFALFSNFALRDILISLCMCIIILQTIKLNKYGLKRNFSNIFILFLGVVSLWFLRKFAALILIGICIFYTILKLSNRKKISIMITLSTIFLSVALVLRLITTVYSIDIISMIENYINSLGISNLIKGLFLSIVNLDFLSNTNANLYESVKLIGLRGLYPETLFLIISFPAFIIGIIKGLKVNREFVISILAFIFGLILIYRIEYGGWFLRIQLQTLPYQYLLISLGICKLFGNSNLLKKLN